MSDLPLTYSNANWPTVSQENRGHGVIRSIPEDFRVIEIPSVEPSGQGEHLWLEIRKKNATSVAVAQALGKWADVPLRDIGWAGRKDKDAVTEQWFSIQLPGKPDPELKWDWPEGIEVLSKRRHDRKLKTGMLNGNRFALVIRDFSGDPSATEAQIKQVAEQGFPNYFGEQRFGRNGDNAESSRAFLAGKKRVRNRDFRSTLISAARSWIFNEILAQRVMEQNWNKALPGDLLMLNGTNSFFACEAVDDSIAERMTNGDIHGSGSLPGSSRDKQTSGRPAEIEQQIFQQYPELLKGLSKKRVSSARRAFRVIPAGLSFEWLAEDRLQLAFELPSGAYATALLRELIRTD